MASNIKQIAKYAEVSIATVSRALSGNPKVVKSTRDKILKIAKELNYNPNIVARNFVKRKSNIIGLIMPDISDDFFSEIIHSIDETAFGQGYFTMVLSSHKNSSMVESINTMMHSGLVAGFILFAPIMSKEIQKALSQNTVPFVLISGSTAIGDYDVITTDNYDASFKLIKYLASLGYKNIGHIEGPQKNIDALLRKKGFVDGCKKYKVTTKPSWIIKGDFTIKGGETAAEKLLKQSKLPAAIYAANDMMALGFCKYAKSHGIKIPKDIAVVGFDDVLLAEHSSPQLSTIKVDTDKMGKTAAEILIDKVKNGNGRAVKKVIVPTEFVSRESC